MKYINTSLALAFIRRSLCVGGLALSSVLFAQTNEELYTKGLKYKAEYNYKEGLAVFQKLMKADSANANYLANGSYFYSRYGRQQATEAEQMKYYHTGEYLARKAIRTDEKNAEAHYALALALGRINENAGSKQKIANAKVIKKEADRAIELNPKHAGAYHILGRWHRTVAGFGSFEKVMINSFFGGVPPGGTFADAVTNFQKAIGLEPKYMLHQYELAVTYHEMGKNIEAKLWAQKALECPTSTEDDKKTKKDCEALLKELK